MGKMRVIWGAILLCLCSIVFITTFDYWRIFNAAASCGIAEIRARQNPRITLKRGLKEEYSYPGKGIILLVRDESECNQFSFLENRLTLGQLPLEELCLDYTSKVYAVKAKYLNVFEKKLIEGFEYLIILTQRKKSTPQMYLPYDWEKILQERLTALYEQSGNFGVMWLGFYMPQIHTEQGEWVQGKYSNRLLRRFLDWEATDIGVGNWNYKTAWIFEDKTGYDFIVSRSGMKHLLRQNEEKKWKTLSGLNKATAVQLFTNVVANVPIMKSWWMWPPLRYECSWNEIGAKGLKGPNLRGRGYVIQFNDAIYSDKVSLVDYDEYCHQAWLAAYFVFPKRFQGVFLEQPLLNVTTIDYLMIPDELQREKPKSLSILRGPNNYANMCVNHMQLLKEKGVNVEESLCLGKNHEDYAQVEFLSPEKNADFRKTPGEFLWKNQFDVIVNFDGILCGKKCLQNLANRGSCLMVESGSQTGRFADVSALVPYSYFTHVYGIKNLHHPTRGRGHVQWPTDIEATQLVKEGSAFRDDMLKILTAGSYAYVVGEPDLIRYIKPNSLPSTVKRPVYIPQPFVPMRYVGPPSPPNDIPLVVHAPSIYKVKGTHMILEAISRLSKERLKFQFKLIHGMSNPEALSWYAKADVVVDQLLIGWHGILALECMSLGKPVITYIAPDLAHIMEPYSEVEGELPVLSATPVTFENVLREALQDSVLRERVGKRARKYVEKFHSPERISNMWLNLYGDCIRDAQNKKTVI